MHLSKYLFISLMCIALPGHAGWQDFFSDVKQNIEEKSDKNSTSLSEKTIITGLKQALNQGIEQSIKQLGIKNGFLKDPSVKIPMPRSLRKVEKGLRKLGRDKVADKFIETMNHAAEQAIPKTTSILITAVKNMTVTDAIDILNGDNDAATQYFKRSSASHLHGAIKPIVERTTNSVGVTENYKKMIKKSGFLSKYIDKNSIDIDQYVTDKAIDGLFLKIAIEEKRIREDPIARTTDVLKNVFGSLKN